MNYFIACDVQPEDFGSIVRCADFNNGNPEVFTESEIIQIYSTSTDTGNTGGTTLVNPSLTNDEAFAIGGAIWFLFFICFSGRKYLEMLRFW